MLAPDDPDAWSQPRRSAARAWAARGVARSGSPRAFAARGFPRGRDQSRQRASEARSPRGGARRLSPGERGGALRSAAALLRSGAGVAQSWPLLRRRWRRSRRPRRSAAARLVAGKGCLMLTLGDFERGLEGYEARWLKGKSLGEALGTRFETWKGPGRPGERVLVLNDHGLGDTIQFFRYLPLMAAAGVEATFVCPPRLRRLLSSKAKVRFVDSPPAGRAVRRPDRDQQPAARIRHAPRHDSGRGSLSRGRAGLARNVGSAHRRRRLQDRRRLARQPRSGGRPRPLHAAYGAWRRSPRSRASGSFRCRRAPAKSSFPFCRRRCGSRRSARISTPGRTPSSTRRRR